MKTLIPIATLLVGLLSGWAVASWRYQHQISVLQLAWSPEFQDFMVETSAEMGKLTEEDVKDVIRYGKKIAVRSLNEGDIQRMWQAILAREMKRLVDADDKQGMLALIEEYQTDFLQAYDVGDYEGDEWEQVAAALADRLREVQESPTTK